MTIGFGADDHDAFYVCTLRHVLPPPSSCGTYQTGRSLNLRNPGCIVLENPFG